MIRAVFFDIDGTLIDHATGQVPADTRAALARLKDAGVLACLATGRSLAEVRHLPVHDIPFDGYCCMTGLVVADKNMEVLASHPMEPATQAAILTEYKKREIPLVLDGLAGADCNMVNDYMRAAHAAIHTPVPTDDQLMHYSGWDIYQVMAYGTPEQLEGLTARIPGVRTTRWNPWAIDIVPATCSKLAGISEFAEKSGFGLDEVMCIGDGENDVEMIAGAGVGVAMGDGSEAAKDVADFVTGPVGAGGIVQALEHYGLI